MRVLTLAPTTAAYWGSNAKVMRDSVEVGSALLGQLTALAWWPKLILPRIFLGVAFFMVGITLEFAEILRIQDRRIEGLGKAGPPDEQTVIFLSLSPYSNSRGEFKIENLI